MNILPSIVLFLLGMLPFIIPYQYRPTPVFPSEAMAFVLALLFTFLAVVRRPRPPRLAATQIYWLLCAFFICIQLVFQTTVYYEFKLIPFLFMLTAAGMSYALTQFKEEISLSSLTDWFLLGILLGSLVNTVIAFAQVYTSITSESVLLVYGGIGQRNMYGNYLMGGFIAFIYLASKYRLRWWVILPLLLWLALSLAWAGSRSILLYLIATFILSIWMYWRKPALRDFCRLLIIGLILAGIAQLVTPYINLTIGWLTGHAGDVPTALDRLTANGSRRLIEWQKAWLIFIEHIWLGAGWGSFPANSIRLHAHYPEFYRIVESALFTHAHNSVLNILAENGVLGSAVILGGFFYLVLTFCRQMDSPEKLALALVLLITTLHSLVEYPLWYFHFFAIFVVCLGLLTAQHWRLPTSGAFIRSGLAVYIVLALTCTGWGYFAYHQLRHWQIPSNDQENSRRLDVLTAFRHNPLVDFHAAMTASAYIDASHDSPIEVLPLLTRLNRSRPYPWQLMYEAILQARVGNMEAAHHLLKLGIYSYPDSLPYFEKSIQQSPYPQVRELMLEVTQARVIFPMIK
jgi:O-antigen ligase